MVDQEDYLLLFTSEDSNTKSLMVIVNIKDFSVNPFSDQFVQVTWSWLKQTSELRWAPELFFKSYKFWDVRTLL